MFYSNIILENLLYYANHEHFSLLICNYKFEYKWFGNITQMDNPRMLEMIIQGKKGTKSKNIYYYPTLIDCRREIKNVNYICKLDDFILKHVKFARYILSIMFGSRLNIDIFHDSLRCDHYLSTCSKIKRTTHFDTFPDKVLRITSISFSYDPNDDVSDNRNDAVHKIKGPAYCSFEHITISKTNIQILVSAQIFAQNNMFHCSTFTEDQHMPAIRLYKAGKIYLCAWFVRGIPHRVNGTHRVNKTHQIHENLPHVLIYYSSGTIHKKMWLRANQIPFMTPPSIEVQIQQMLHRSLVEGPALIEYDTNGKLLRKAWYLSGERVM
jgi:hypothetical protein